MWWIRYAENLWSHFVCNQFRKISAEIFENNVIAVRNETKVHWFIWKQTHAARKIRRFPYKNFGQRILRFRLFSGWIFTRALFHACEQCAICKCVCIVCCIYYSKRNTHTHRPVSASARFVCIVLIFALFEYSQFGVKRNPLWQNGHHTYARNAK